ncbi:MAG: hypothetical protein Q7J86_05180, partial [Bacteroidota bacterium]|nr:hypothetical protein [Bacteroidota bacterium]
MMKKIIFLSIVLFLISEFVSLAQNQTLELKQSNETGIYKKGEKIRVMAFVQNRTNDSICFVVRKNNDQIISEKAFLPEADSLLIFEGSSSKPSSFMVEARIKEQKQLLGMIVDPQNLKPGIKAPQDINKYWNSEKQNL